MTIDDKKISFPFVSVRFDAFGAFCLCERSLRFGKRLQTQANTREHRSAASTPSVGTGLEAPKNSNLSPCYQWPLNFASPGVVALPAFPVSCRLVPNGASKVTIKQPRLVCRGSVGRHGNYVFPDSKRPPAGILARVAAIVAPDSVPPD